ncbi:MAG: lipocalin-like domain-containing protein [Actinomycetota bacterium]|nr:lipocalin-like domain-containing protein [Actinomycetota bacterium]
MAANPLVGTWRLVSWENRDIVDGRVDYPLGEDAVGYIMYGQDGFMSVAIARPDRPTFSAGDLLGGSAGERERAAETYVSYCGTYEFRGTRWSIAWNSACFPTGSASSRSVSSSSWGIGWF